MTGRKTFYIYILSNKHNTVLYTGVTDDLIRRVYEHKNKLIEGFTKRYNITKLLYYESTESAESAILREKQVKDYRRDKKFGLVRQLNPEMRDLYPKLVV
ncbi:MAG: excinuclease ABC subunit C [Omnitrophica bacterium RIFCSPHIGHO2_02_FULL_51_18]|nr:MAG: excinuclease ABC subunit C [Omnitrophica bacterium RIFCSPHIGHO2_02_FULL_51_18]